jgi:hypothetical protein
MISIVPLAVRVGAFPLRSPLRSLVLIPFLQFANPVSTILWSLVTNDPHEIHARGRKGSGPLSTAER